MNGKQLKEKGIKDAVGGWGSLLFLHNPTPPPLAEVFKYCSDMLQCGLLGRRVGGGYDHGKDWILTPFLHSDRSETRTRCADRGGAM